ncbi:MAG: dihydrolipoyl dehydrogenase [Chloroflexi bacterium]|nr:dihydrolipoyl dehydrogenase [Chloroflexota bacterium]OJV89189.1 MAG: dihydrolipoyl dehydrogenase [Chloroflexi bacterium 54-19]
MTASNGQTGSYDLVIIGSGPGGYIAAARAGQLGLKTAIVEREELGGVCLNWGCIPSKALLRSAEVLSLFARSKDFGITVSGVEADYGAAIARCNDIIGRQTKGVAYLMKKNKVDVLRGTGRIESASKVVVEGPEGTQEVTTKNIMIATGSRVRLVPGMSPDTVDGTTVVTSKEIWKLKDKPQSVAIIGGGPIGVEFATVYRSYGCDVTIVEMLPRLVPLEDEEISAHLTREFKKRGINIMTNTMVKTVEKGGEGKKAKVTVQAGKDGPTQTLEVDRVLLGIGFAPNSENLGLEKVGVKVERGFIQVDDQMKTNVPGIYAIGDVTGKLPLAHVASAMGVIASEIIAGEHAQKLNYANMPRCTYSAPNIASLGLTEAQCKERGIEVKVGKFMFNPNGKAQALGEASGFVKVVSDAKYGQVLGAHMIGPEVVELIGEFSLLTLLEGTNQELAMAVHPHPTLSEALAEAGLAVDGLALNA